MFVVIPFCHKDEWLALKNLEWAKKLDRRVPYSCLIVHDDQISGERVIFAAEQYFAKVMEFTYRHFQSRDTRWPRIQNNQFQETATYISYNGPKDSWFWWEPDAVPLKSGWITAIATEHARGGKAFTGFSVTGKPILSEPTTTWMTGCGVYPYRLPSLSGLMMSCMNIPWDVAGGKDAMRSFHSINHLIHHVWEIDGKPPTFASKSQAKEFINPSAVLFHRCKDGSLIDVLSGGGPISSIIESVKQCVASISDSGQKTVRSHKTTDVEFSVSILAYDRIDCTKKCLSSVLADRSREYELILTNNGSTDGTKEYFDHIADTNPNVTVIHNSSNLGFSEPNNHAFSISRGKYFVMLNNDAVVPPGWLGMLAAPLENSPSAALSGPMGTCNSWRPDRFSGIEGNLEYVEGACLCCKSSIIRKSGLFSPYIKFAYCEDCDLSLRLRAQGYTIHQVGFSLVHERSSTSIHVKGIRDIANRNVTELTRRWGHYLKVRRLDYPIVVKRDGAAGDVLLTTPVIRALKRKMPQSPIYVETQFPDIFNGNPNVVGAFRAIKSPSKDAQIIDLNMAYENSPMTPIVAAFLHQAAVDGDDRTEMFVSGENMVWAEDAIACDSTPIAAVHADRSTWPGKTWPAQRWAEVAKWLMDKGYRVALVGGDTEIVDHVPHSMSFVAKTSIQQLAAVLSKCRIFVGGDSFPMHIAQAVGVDVVALFGATLPEMILTSGSKSCPVVADASIKCAGERHRVAGSTFVNCDGECMRSIDVESVKGAVIALTQ